ncbi:MAG: hypothetical protein JXB18_12725 [Sedimentisphaerales bacterium]|nr:hypothetical protein [Sedimentisphaerales bacterium]
MATSEHTQLWIDELVLKNTYWFYTLGPKSEWLHDQIDLASVRSGRQKTVGDGSPMTSWHEDVNTYAEMADFVCPATNDFCVILVIGNISDFEQFMIALIHKLFNSDNHDIDK